jgi:hypothetical protein
MWAWWLLMIRWWNGVHRGFNPRSGSLWRPPHTGVPEIVGRQSQPLRWTFVDQRAQISEARLLILQRTHDLAESVFKTA